MPAIHTEETFETAIVAELVANGGYVEGSPAEFDRTDCLDKGTLLRFLKDSQPKKWDKIMGIHGANAESMVIARMMKEIDLRGSLDVIRNGFTDHGVRFDLAYFKPETTLNPDAVKLYDKNILTVTRQVKYTTKNENELDLVLSINGLPLVTVELKNQMTGQNVDNAMKQYKFDRDPKDLMFRFKKRALVHFTVDTDEAYMTTKLAGRKTFYLPFNLGHNNGKGNPLNPDGYRTAYLWEQVWTKDSLMEIVQRFLHLDKKEDGTETMIFPRYHQLDVVRKLAVDARENGSGKNYLIQHSAGSGKSNSIAWLSYRLSSLHNDLDKRIFDSVIVITDRKVLDNQLQDTIYQFEHKSGVVQKIDVDSTQLAEAIYHGSNIVISTLQKFPFIIEKISDIEKEMGDRSKRRYAVIIDEAHSSQGGKASTRMKEVLAGQTLEEAAAAEREDGDTDIEDEIRRQMLARGQHKNLSFFAFTATPKPKTLEAFGVKGRDEKFRPFHLYSMKQAIEEKFIHDVLKNYTTYKTFFKLTKAIEDDPELDTSKAKRAIARFISLHPHNLAQKTEVMAEHFRQVVKQKLKGKAKAMIVTASRLHAVRYKAEFDRYIKEQGYIGIKALVAFSGTVIDDGEELKETKMNGFGEKELPKRFDSDDYQVLIVADKYQTGFDQPKLHTMYVDKKLSGVKAVQTLSRLNRTCSNKEDTFVLDFTNSEEDIKTAFQPYYELTALETMSDPNHLYDMKTQIEAAQIIWESEVENFAKVLFQPTYDPKDQAKLNAYIDPAVERFKELPEESEREDVITQDSLKHQMSCFIRAYSFIAQIMPFADMELEKFNVYVNCLRKKLPKKGLEEALNLDDDLDMEFFRVKKHATSDIALEAKSESDLTSGNDGGVKNKAENELPLSDIIRLINERFNTEWSDADRLQLQQIIEDCANDEQLQQSAKVNTPDNFKYMFDDKFINKVIDRMDQNQSMATKIISEPELAIFISNHIMQEVYTRAKAV